MQAPEALAQGADGGDSYIGLLLTTVVLLIVVCVVAVVVVRLLRRGLEGKPVGERVVEVVARVPLEPRRAIYVVRVGGKALVVGASEGGMSLLSELPEEAVPAVEPSGMGRRFGELVAAAWGRRRTPVEKA